MSISSTPSRRKRNPRRVVGVMVGGIIGSLMLAFSFSPSFAAFTASIQNSIDTAGTGTLVMRESTALADSSVVNCSSSDNGSGTATCATINKYGGKLDMAPGESVTTSVTIANTGTVDATAFTLTPGACAQEANGSPNGTATDLCAKYNIEIKSGATTIFTGTLASLASGGIIDLLPGASDVVEAGGSAIPFSFKITLDSTATSAYAGLKVSQPLTWTFTA